MDLTDGESTPMKGSAAQPYVLKNTGGVYSCSCPAWRNQGAAIERRTCKHLRKLRGDAAEQERIAGPGAPSGPPRVRQSGEHTVNPGAGTTGGEPGAAESPLSRAPPVLLAQSWTDDDDIAGWWMSEKLDGVRAWWDGSSFWSRLGNRYHAPPWFEEGLPNEPLDGELWIGRKLFQRTVSTVRRQDQGETWRDVRYVVFDAPGGPTGAGQAAAFEQRVERIPGLVASAPFAEAHPHERCTDLRHLIRELDRVCALGGEGLMLRQPGSAYEAGRSATLLKVKRFLDGEARVVGHLPGAGKHKGRLGALAVTLDDGTRFSVGTGLSDRERDDPPPIGAIVSFRYQELSDGGVPRFPAYIGVRDDVGGAKPLGAGPAPAPITFPVRLEADGRFWDVVVDGPAVTTRGGPVGSRGQLKTVTHPSEPAATLDAARFVREKLARGYTLAASTPKDP